MVDEFARRSSCKPLAASEYPGKAVSDSELEVLKIDGHGLTMSFSGAG